jgi:2-iminobutanoate/2-iminopropanoate deaminase
MPLLLMGRDAHATGEQANGLAPNTPPALQHSSTPVPLRCVKVRGAVPLKVETSTPPNTPTPIGPYSHVAKVGQFITIGGTAGVNPATGQLAGSDVYAQTRQILESFKVMLASVGSDLDHVIHVNVFLQDMKDFEQMNAACAEMMGEHRPARTVIGVHELPKPGVLLTMNLTAVTSE